VTGVAADEIVEFALTLERSERAVVHGRVKVRVRGIVYLALDRDETAMGFAFPKEERDALVASAPDVFALPRPSDLRHHWAVARLDRLDPDEACELVLDAWAMVVPKKLWVPRLARPVRDA